jgi:hypothetical protein
VGYTSRKGFCIKQPLGINTFGSKPKKITLFLNLSNPEEYTSLLADTKTDILTTDKATWWVEVEHGCRGNTTEIFQNCSSKNIKNFIFLNGNHHS